MKSLVRARDAAEVLPDIFRSTSGSVTAALSFFEGGTVATVRLGDEAPPSLQQITFYDERCGDLYVSKEGEASYRPSALALFDGLIRVCDTVRAAIDSRLADLSRNRVALPELDAATPRIEAQLRQRKVPIPPRPGLESLHLARNLRRRQTPINRALGFGQRFGHCRQTVILGLGRDRASQPGRQRCAQQLSALRSQAIHQRPALLSGRDRQLRVAQNWAGVHARIHQHDRRTGFRIARQQRAGHRGCAAVARQEGRVHVEAAVRRQIEHSLRQNQAIPVSYTHLRAHETVLDLVCRLLLEKKNTQLKSYRHHR